MKNKLKFFEAMRSIAIIAVVAIIGFSMIACDDDGEKSGTSYSAEWTDARMLVTALDGYTSNRIISIGGNEDGLRLLAAEGPISNGAIGASPAFPSAGGYFNVSVHRVWLSTNNNTKFVDYDVVGEINFMVFIIKQGINDVSIKELFDYVESFEESGDIFPSWLEDVGYTTIDFQTGSDSSWAISGGIFGIGSFESLTN